MSSITFLYFFLPLFAGLYAVTPKKHRIKTLLLGECVFFGWRSLWALLPLFVSSMFTYLFGMLIDNRRNEKQKQLKFLIAMIGTELIFITLSVMSSGGLIKSGLIQKAFPPLGVFVYALTSLSYCLDIYKGVQRCDHRFSLVAAFTGFFPCLTAGPLMRYSEVSLQFEAPEISADKMSRGISLYLKGLAEKCVISATVSGMWKQLIKLDITAVSAATAWLGIIAAGMYVYFEFASITHMASGISLMLGIELPKNFDHPFRAVSVREYVKKFNTSVTMWFIDYIYEPINSGGKKRRRTVLAALATGILISLWYGPGISRLVFGIYIGLLFLIEMFLLEKPLNKLPRPAKVFVTMALVHIGIVFFISNDTGYAFSYILATFGRNGMLIDNLTLYFFENFAFILGVCLFITTGLADLIGRKLEGSKVSIIPFIRPVWQLGLLVLCTAFLSGMAQSIPGIMI